MLDDTNNIIKICTENQNLKTELEKQFNRKALFLHSKELQFVSKNYDIIIFDFQVVTDIFKLENIKHQNIIVYLPDNISKNPGIIQDILQNCSSLVIEDKTIDNLIFAIEQVYINTFNTFLPGEKFIDNSLKKFNLKSQILQEKSTIFTEKEQYITLKKINNNEVHYGKVSYKKLVENASDIITILGETGTILYENPAVFDVLGYTPAELINTNVFDKFHPDDIQNAIKILSQLTENKPVTCKYRGKHKNGSWIYLESAGKTFLDENALNGAVIITRDMTIEKKREEAEIKELHAKYKNLTDKQKITLFYHAVGLNRKEIGQKMKINYSTVCSNFTEIRKQFEINKIKELDPGIKLMLSNDIFKVDDIFKKTL